MQEDRRVTGPFFVGIYGSFLKNGKMAAVIEVCCSETAPLALFFLAELPLNICSGPSNFEWLRC